MKLARYWSRDGGEAVDARGRRIRIVARGWSDESIDGARAKARETAGRLAERVATGFARHEQYQYGDRPPPVEFPFETPQAEDAFRRWEQDYNRQAAGFATCQFVAAFGHRGDDPAFYDLLVYHDQQTRAGVYMPLA